jgi:hypothetical protein
LSGHVRGVHSLPNQNKSSHDVADAPFPLLTINDSSVLEPRCSQTKKVVVVTEDDPAFGQAIGKLVLVDRSEKTQSGVVVTSIRRRRSPAAMACEQFSSR